jgi:geranylgeranyl pyrophosphate synthase
MLESDALRPLPDGTPFEMKASRTPSFLRLYLEKKPVIEQHLAQFIADARQGNLLPEDVAGAVDYGVMTLGGKRARPMLVHLAHNLVGGNFLQIDKAAIIPELPHKGSLMEDDVDDHALQREGKPPAYRAFGETVNRQAYEFLYQSPALIINELSTDEAVKQRLLEEYVEYAKRAREGQQMELDYSVEGLPMLDFVYGHMAMLKCAAFTYAVRVGAILGGASEQQINVLTQIADRSGVCFQIQDDLQGINKNSQSYGEDITEGHMNILTGTIQFILWKLRHPDGKRLYDIFRLHTTDRELIDEAVGIINKWTYFDITADLADALSFPAYEGQRINRLQWSIDSFADGLTEMLHGAFPEETVARRQMEELIGFCKTGSF